MLLISNIFVERCDKSLKCKGEGLENTGGFGKHGRDWNQNISPYNHIERWPLKEPFWP
jgi:hypothetical protein